MSTLEAGGQRDEGEYGRAAKRPKMEEPPLEEKEDRAEDELEEGEDSDSGSLPGNGEAETESGHRGARWSGRQFGSGRKVRRAGMLLPNGTNQRVTQRLACARPLVRCYCLSVTELSSISKVKCNGCPMEAASSNSLMETASRLPFRSQSKILPAVWFTWRGGNCNDNVWNKALHLCLVV